MLIRHLKHLIAILILGVLLSLGSLSNAFSFSRSVPPETGAEIVLLLNREIYEMSDFGEPPQVAIWIEYVKNLECETIYVTRRTARARWKGKVECPVSLPIWEKNIKKFEKNLDAMTAATPKSDRIQIKFKLNSGVLVRMFLEINVSGDYNRTFPYRNVSGMPDPQGNGQPSLIYSTGIFRVSGKTHVPFQLIGRSDQWKVVSHIISDLKGITSAGKLIKKAEIRIQ